MPTESLSAKVEDQDEDKYIVFALAGELYGTPLLDVREVVEPLPTKEIPHTIKAFTGVMNLRGQIVGVIDLNTRFSLQSSSSEQQVLLVFESDNGILAARVDRIVTVTVIPESAIDKSPMIISNVPQAYLLGVGKMDNSLVTLMDLKKILGSEELITIEKETSRPGHAV